METPVFITVKPLHNGQLGDRRKWPLLIGGRYGEEGVQYDKFILGSAIVAKFMLVSTAL